MRKVRNLFYLCLVFAAIALTGCAPQEGGNKTAGNSGVAKDPNRKLKIGFAMATVKEERWQRDQEAFDAYCKEKGVDCRITVADNKPEKQANDVDQLLTQGIDVLVIAPDNATQAASMVEKAKAQGVPVISYDRLINSNKIDVYISHQVPVIGQKIAEYALNKVPKGNYIMIYGDSTDNNAVIMRKEQEKVLKAAMDKGDINVVFADFTKGWKAEVAQNNVENALTKAADKVDAIVCSNDGTASGAVSALSARGLAGKVLVTGQDAQKDALQRIAEGKQTMTVYKPIIPLARAAVDAAIKLAKNEQLTEAKPFKTDSMEVMAILLEVTVVDKDNLMSTVIKDGYAKYEDVYANVPEDKRPKKE